MVDRGRNNIAGNGKDTSQHFNGSGQESARLSCTSDAPLTINLYHDLEFVFVEAVEAQLDDLRELGGAGRGRAQLRRAPHADGDADAYLFGLHHSVCNRRRIIHSGRQVSFRVRSAGTLRWRVVPSVMLGGGTISPVLRGGSALARGGGGTAACAGT